MDDLEAFQEDHSAFEFSRDPNEKSLAMRQGFCVFAVPYHAVALPVGAIGPVKGGFRGSSIPTGYAPQ
jgi:hypothetical protein